MSKGNLNRIANYIASQQRSPPSPVLRNVVDSVRVSARSESSTFTQSISTSPLSYRSVEGTSEAAMAASQPQSRGNQMAKSPPTTAPPNTKPLEAKFPPGRAPDGKPGQVRTPESKSPDGKGAAAGKQANQPNTKDVKLQMTPSLVPKVREVRHERRALAFREATKRRSPSIIVPIKERVKSFRPLKYSESCKVKHYYGEIEDITGYSMNNVYVITVPNRFSFDVNDETPVFYLGERICCEKSLLQTSGRKMDVQVLSADGELIACLRKDCTPCLPILTPLPCLHKLSMKLVLPDGRRVGRMVRKFQITLPRYDIYDSEDMMIFSITGPACGNICPFWLGFRNFWHVTNAEGPVRCNSTASGEVPPPAVIMKQCTWLCEENVYSVTFLADEMKDAKHKMLLACTLYFIDMMHFRRLASTCQLITWLVVMVLIIFVLVMTFYCFIIQEDCRNWFRWLD